MDKRGYWRRKLDSVQEWSSVERGCVPIALAGLLYLQYLLWGWFALARDNADALVDAAFLAAQGRVAGAIVAAAALLLVAGRWLDRRQPEALWFQHLGAQFYGLSLAWGAYLAGTLSITTGIVLAGAPLLGFLLLDRRVMVVSITVTFGVVLLLNLLSAGGVLPYAPALRAPGDTGSALFWVGSHFTFAAPHLIANTALSAVLLDQWRRREARVVALSITDALTQVHNRRHILDRLEAEVARARREGTTLAVAMLDLDHFKQINDRYGHPAGDYVLQEAARVLRDGIRAQDAVGRLGGEEFLVLLPGTEPETAMAVMEQCRQALAALTIPADGGGVIPVTASIGVACCDTRMEPVGAALVQAADSALYAAKFAGRNRVCVADRATVAAAVDADAGQFATTNIRRRPVNQPWWQSQSGWRQKAAHILEWHMLDKAALMLSLILIMQAGAVLGVLVDLLRPGAVALADLGVARSLLWLQLAQGSMALLLFGVARKLRQSRAEAPWFEPLTLVFCGLAMVSMGYGTGILGISTGVILTCGPLVCFILFHRDTVLAAFAVALAGVVGLACAAALGLVPYAPLVSFAGPVWQPTGPYWVLINYLFMLPVLCGGLALADQILGRWREREARIRQMGLTDALTEQCRAQIAAAEFHGDNDECLRITASFGLACHAAGDEAGADALIRLADNALYLAKESGRNCVQAGAASAA